MFEPYEANFQAVNTSLMVSSASWPQTVLLMHVVQTPERGQMVFGRHEEELQEWLAKRTPIADFGVEASGFGLLRESRGLGFRGE